MRPIEITERAISYIHQRSLSIYLFSKIKMSCLRDIACWNQTRYLSCGLKLNWLRHGSFFRHNLIQRKASIQSPIKSIESESWMECMCNLDATYDTLLRGDRLIGTQRKLYNLILAVGRLCLSSTVRCNLHGLCCFGSPTSKLTPRKGPLRDRSRGLCSTWQDSKAWEWTCLCQEALWFQGPRHLKKSPKQRWQCLNFLLLVLPW